jgi:hypothetical protein
MLPSEMTASSYRLKLFPGVKQLFLNDQHFIHEIQILDYFHLA